MWRGWVYIATTAHAASCRFLDGNQFGNRHRASRKRQPADRFLTIDENGQRLFAITTLDGTPQKASLTVVQLAAVPLAIGSLSASTVPEAGGASITIRGSGFQSGIKVTIGGKSAAANFVDMNTITATAPALTAGPQQIILTNTSGETISLDAALTAN
jgi:hypothetical protein